MHHSFSTMTKNGLHSLLSFGNYFRYQTMLLLTRRSSKICKPMGPGWFNWISSTGIPKRVSLWKSRLPAILPAYWEVELPSSPPNTHCHPSCLQTNPHLDTYGGFLKCRIPKNHGFQHQATWSNDLDDLDWFWASPRPPASSLQSSVRKAWCLASSERGESSAALTNNQWGFWQVASMSLNSHQFQWLSD